MEIDPNSHRPETVEQAVPLTKTRGPSRFWVEYYISAVLLLIAAFVGVAYVIHRPMILNIKETNAETTQRLQTLERQRAFLVSLSQSIAASRAISPEALDQVNRALPSGAQIPLLLLEFGTSAAQRNVKIGSITFAEAMNAREPASTPRAASRGLVAVPVAIPIDISLTLNAQTYADVKRFLADIEASRRLMDVIGIAMSAGGASKETTYQIQLRTYMFGALKEKKI